MVAAGTGRAPGHATACVAMVCSLVHAPLDTCCVHSVANFPRSTPVSPVKRDYGPIMLHFVLPGKPSASGLDVKYLKVYAGGRDVCSSRRVEGHREMATAGAAQSSDRCWMPSPVPKQAALFSPFFQPRRS